MLAVGLGLAKVKHIECGHGVARDDMESNTSRYEICVRNTSALRMNSSFFFQFSTCNTGGKMNILHTV